MIAETMAGRRQMDCLVWEGLGNRINAIASCLATDVSRVTLWWAVNKHCPVPYQDVFKPIDRLTVRNVAADKFPYSRDSRRYCYYYATNLSQVSRHQFSRRIREQYKTILRSLIVGRPVIPAGKIAGFHYRKHLPESPDVETFITAAKRWLKQQQASPATMQVFVSSDDAASESRILAAIPNAFVIPQKQLSSDFDRSAESLMSFCKALKVFKSCRAGVFASTFRSTAVDSVRGYGVKISYCESEQNHRDHPLEAAINVGKANST